MRLACTSVYINLYQRTVSKNDFITELRKSNSNETKKFMWVMGRKGRKGGKGRKGRKGKNRFFELPPLHFLR